MTTTFIPQAPLTNAPIVQAENGHAFANSEAIAACFGKRHADVLRAARDLIAMEKSCERNFAFTSRPVVGPNGGTRNTTTIKMTRDGFVLLAMSFTGKLALQWKLRYIEAFNAMERQLAEIAARPRQEHAVDRMDRGLDLLITCHAALASPLSIERREIDAIAATLDLAREAFEPVRTQLDEI